jgi:prolyl-tRNA synthetase
MRLTQSLSKTLREEPAEAETISHRLMLKAGMMAQVAAGVYAYLPLALRSLRKIERIVREEMDAAGGQEVRMPALQPVETWKESGRSAAFGEAMFHLKDRRGRELVLAPTHEEVVTALVRANVSSYRDLPLLVYQIQTKYRDEPRPRAGLLRGREFDMKDAYSFDTNAQGLDQKYQRMMQSYQSIFDRCGLPVLVVEADSGAIGGKDSHEFIMPAQSGEDTVLRCPTGDYAANAERATAVRAPAPERDPLEMELTSTPGAETIADVSKFLDVSTAQTLKTVFYRIDGNEADGETVLVTIRGDLEVNEVKLKNLLHAQALRLATADESTAAGLTPGYASPIGMDSVRRIADESVQQGSNFVAGANLGGHHYQNVNYPRDFTVDKVVDVALAQTGQGCPVCGTPLEEVRGIEVGHVFKLGTFFSETLGTGYLDEQGQRHPVIMGCYGIGVTRVLAAAIEQNHDDRGITFPAPIAPYQVHLVALNVGDEAVFEAAERIYMELTEQGYEVLYDDRQETAGVKFNDADLLGLPLRVVVSPRNMAKGTLEVKRRRASESIQVPFEALERTLRELLAQDPLA